MPKYSVVGVRDLAEGSINKELDSSRDAFHGSREKTISYEEAFKRELQYRKLTNLRALPLAADSESLPASPQDHLSLNTDYLVGMKRKGEAHRFDDQTQYSSLRQYQCSRALQHETQVQKTTDSRVSHLWCDICKIVCMGAFNLKQHLQGKKHKAKCSQTCDIKNKLLWCQECNVPCINEMSLAQHRVGKKHVHRMYELHLKDEL